MAIISGVTVDWSVSPRIITIPDTETAVTIQDLHDTIRDIEDEPNAMQYTHLVSSAGKESLGGGVFVGITMTLHNAKLKFEDRAGPSTVQCNVSGGNLVAVDGVGGIIFPVEPSDFTHVVIRQSTSAALVEDSIIFCT
jgi:hypothetical protein